MSELKSMAKRVFIDAVKQNNECGQRFCFILGAGASFKSGIRTGEALMRKWHKDLLEMKDKNGLEYIKERAIAARYEWDDCKHLFEDTNPILKNEEYFMMYDMTYVGSSAAGYDFLEQEMNGKTPNVGYYYLANILENTDNKLVITTNFDSLTEDALFHCSGSHPLVIGHERLASYVKYASRRPVVAKVHRDLLMGPMNRKKEMQTLQNEWKNALRSAFTQYIPIVIGYAGGDKTLMSLLEEIDLDGVFWCTLKGELPPPKAQEIIEKNNGHWVEIPGFDEIMYLLTDKLTTHPTYEELKQRCDDRCEDYSKKHEKLKSEYSTVTPQKIGEKTVIIQDIDMSIAVNREDEKNDPKVKEFKDKYFEAMKMYDAGEFQTALDLCESAIKIDPDNAEGYNLRSLINHSLNDFEKSLEDITKAIELVPDDDAYYFGKSVILDDMGKREDSILEVSTAIELNPDVAYYYYMRGVTLHALKRYEEAVKDETKAVELDSNVAEFYMGRGVTLSALKHYEEAVKDATKAVELEPSNARYYNERAKILCMLKRFEDALKDMNITIELDSDVEDYYIGRGFILDELGCHEEALADKAKAEELSHK